MNSLHGWREQGTRIIAILVTLSLVFGQEAKTPSAEELRAQLQALEAQPSDAQAAQVDMLQQALASLDRAAVARAKTQQFNSEIAEAPIRLASLLDELATAPTEPDLAANSKQSLYELENRSAQAQADLAAMRKELTELEDTAQHRLKRNSELPEEIATNQRAQTAAQESLTNLAPGPENETRRALLLAQLDEFRAVAESLEKERNSYDARREVLPLRRDRALRRLSKAQTIANFWKEQVDTRRTQEGDSASQNAKEQLAAISARFPSLAGLAASVQELAAQRAGEDGLPRRISSARATTETIAARGNEIRSRFKSAQERVRAGGLTEGMGRILRRDYEWLPLTSDLKSQSSARKKRLSTVQLDSIATEEALETLKDFDRATDQLLTELEIESPSEELRTAARELLTSERAAYLDLKSDLDTLSALYTKNEQLSSDLLQETLTYRAFIEKRILWVRSAPLNPIPSFLATPTDAANIVHGFWDQGLSQGWMGLVSKRAGTLVGICCLWIVMFFSRRKVKRLRRRMGENVRSFRTDKYIYTGRALGQTLFLALPFPFLAWTAGWFLGDSSADLLRATGSALTEIAAIWLFLRIGKELTSEGGVGLAHFKWPAARMSALRRELRWFEPAAVVLGICVLTLDRQGTAEWADSIGRLCFIGCMLALAIFTRRLLASDRALDAGKDTEEDSLDLRSVIAIGLPIALALMALAGYYYTALQFELRLRYSIGYGALLVLIDALLHRWLLMTRRKLAVKQAIEARARREAEEETKGPTESHALAIDADKVDIPAIDAQTRQLFKTSISLATFVGLFFIWAGVLPALRGLDSIQILPTLAIVSPEVVVDMAPPPPASEPLANDSTSAAPGSDPLPGPMATSLPDSTASSLGLPTRLTLADILLAICFGLLAGFAAKNLPALLELAVLQRMPLDGGARYAVSTIVRYVILIAGVSAVSSTLGIGWHHVQWLAAALTFGIAFGLQEIFANFISGLIILIERPIRVGDIVTVAGTEGRVTQLRMRATTILDWDQRELLVPNKEFITGSIINWTLSDPVTRMVIPVGIAYGSDTQLARKLLLQVAKGNLKVLDSPAPSAIFRSFGDSSLDFQLRVFIANRDYWADITDQLHSQIDAAFRKAGIEIAFPQRDLHIRSAEGLRQLDQEMDDAPPPKAK